MTDRDSEGGYIYDRFLDGYPVASPAVGRVRSDAGALFRFARLFVFLVAAMVIAIWIANLGRHHHPRTGIAPMGPTNGPCPCCHSERVARIIYGDVLGVDIGPDVWGGCVVTANSPRRYCKACGLAWRTDEPPPF
jgi:hypothetical protein